MQKPTIHIGKLILQQVKSSGINRSEFARRINTTRQNIDNIARRESIDSLLLFQISEVLQFDFFQLYTSQLPFTNTPINDHQSEKIKLLKQQITLQNKLIKALEKEII